MKTPFLILFLLALALPMAAQNQPVGVRGNAALTNSLTVSTAPCKVYSVLGYNSSVTGTNYIQIFQTSAGATNGATPTFSFPVPQAGYYSLDLGLNGVDLDACVVKVSTNAATLGLAPAAVSIQVLKKN